MSKAGMRLPSRSPHHALVGTTIGRQTVIDMRRIQRTLFAIARCECGWERPVSPRHLLAGRSDTCKRCTVTARIGKLNRGWRGGTHVPMTVFNKFRRSATRRGIVWNLSIGDVDELFDKQQGRCALSGVDLVFDFGQRNGCENGNASLDRMDHRSGYEPGNVRLTTKIANLARQRFTDESFVEMCRAVAAHYGSP